MKLFIPSIGDKLKLTSDWEFPCFTEYRNTCLVEILRPDVKLPQQRWNYDGLQTVAITFPKGTILRVDRIYIRKGKQEWDSVTFVVAFHPEAEAKGIKKVLRFWAKLVDVNEIDCELFTGEIPKPVKTRARKK